MNDGVRLRLRALMAEKFIKRALEAGVALGDVERLGEREICFTVSERDAARVRELAARYGLAVEQVKLVGRARLRDALRRRPSLPAAVALAVLLCALALSRVWFIALPDEDPARFAAALKKAGVRVGMPVSRIDTRQIESYLLAELGDFAYVGARLDGVRLKIEAVRELPRPDLYDPANSRDLVASRDAVIVSINAFAGEAAVKAGDTVRRGQLLIRGEERISDESTGGVCALGEVVGRCWVSAQRTAPLTQRRAFYTGRESAAARLRLMEYSYPLTQAERYASCEQYTQRLPVGGLFLPLVIERTTFRETQLRTVALDEAQLRAQLAEQAVRDALLTAPEGSVLVDKWIDYSMIEGDIICARAVLEINMSIAVTRDALDTGGT